MQPDWRGTEVVDVGEAEKTTPAGGGGPAGVVLVASVWEEVGADLFVGNLGGGRPDKFDDLHLAPPGRVLKC
ncbi:protein of unknown function [Aminobacter niigataensis]|nr:protein of unknown function [Aminobacter niigataensis]